MKRGDAGSTREPFGEPSIPFASHTALVHWGTGIYLVHAGGANCLFVDGHVEFIRAINIIPANDNLPDVNLTMDGVEGKDVN